MPRRRLPLGLDLQPRNLPAVVRHRLRLRRALRAFLRRRSLPAGHLRAVAAVGGALPERLSLRGAALLLPCRRPLPRAAAGGLHQVDSSSRRSVTWFAVTLISRSSVLKPLRSTRIT